MAAKYQIGAEVNKTPYTGDDSTQALYSGYHKTTLQAVALGDTVEIPLFEIPVGARVNAFKFAIDAAIGVIPANVTAKWVLRKKSNSIYSTDSPMMTGTASGLPDVQALTSAALSGVAGVGAFAAAAAGVVAPVITAATQGDCVVLAQGFEGNTTINGALQARATLTEAYYFGLLLTCVTGATSIAAGINIFAAVDAEFLGTL